MPMNVPLKSSEVFYLECSDAIALVAWESFLEEGRRVLSRCRGGST
jgi:hypothetical protein